jgi:hypothetical protein
MSKKAAALVNRTTWGILLLLLGLGFRPGNAQEASTPSGPTISLPAEILGWKAVGPAQVFDGTTLGRYMVGGEEFYLAYDFRKLTSRVYARQGAPRLTAEIFEMGSSEEAFGLFTNEREAVPAEVGNEGLAGSRFLQFWKGRMFVRVLTEHETPEARKALSALAQAIASALPAGGRKPLVVSCLPTQDLVPGRVSFLHSLTTLERLKFPGDAGVLRLGPGTDAAYAQYHRGGQPLETLVVLYPSDDIAHEAWRAVLDVYFGVRGNAPAEVTIKKIAPGSFAAGRLTGRVLILAFGAADRRALQALSDQIDSRTREVFGY